MKTLQLLESIHEHLEFSDDRPLAKPLLVEQSGRVLRFTLNYATPWSALVQSAILSLTPV